MKTKFSDSAKPNLDRITLGGGCFWCTEGIFHMVEGVVKVEPGYAGGNIENPTYEKVSTGSTGHAEVVQITFDSNLISVREILEIFFATHDPTTLNRQGADVGTQYRSVIFFHTAEQRRVAKNLIEELNNTNIWEESILTELQPFNVFYKAEDYHVNYYTRHKTQPYCRIVIDPKLRKLRKRFKDKLKKL